MRRWPGALAAVAMAVGLGTTAAAGADAPAVNPATYSYLTEPTDQLGVPGYQAGAEITPTGSIYTGYRELAFRIGPRLVSLGTTARTLLDGRYPIFLYRLTSGDVTYAVSVFATAVGGTPVNFIRVQMDNRTAAPQRAGWGTGLMFAGGRVLSTGGRAYRFAPTGVFTGQCAYRSGGGSVDTAAGALAETYSVAPRGFALRRSDARLPAGPVTEATQCGLLDYTGTLAPGTNATLDFALPVLAPEAHSAAATQLRQANLDQQLSADAAAWRRVDAGAMQIQLPEAKVTDSFYASLAWMAMSRYPAAPGGQSWIQTPNKLQYNAFFIRDAAFIARAFDVAGLHGLAAQDLDYFPAVQGGDGDFVSQPDQLDGFGEALWAIGQHAQWPDQRRFAVAMLGPVQRAVAWLVQARAQDPLGLIPVSDPGDNELVSGHITGDDFLAADGLSEAVALAKLAGAPKLAATWQGILGSFLVSLRAALAQAETLTGGWIPPSLEDNGGQNWGNLWASYPLAVTLSPGSAAVTATLAHVTAGFREGIATYGNVLHDYLGFRVFETELQRGEQADVVAGLYAELAHTTATDGGFELGIRAGAPRLLDTDMAPHGWFAAEYVTLLRNMLVRESGDGVLLMAAVSPDWLTPGQTIAVHGAGTDFGTVSYRLHAFRGGATLRWSAALAHGTPLRWQLPAGATDVEAAGLRRGSRQITLARARGQLTVHWRLRWPVPSFVATAARLQEG